MPGTPGTLSDEVADQRLHLDDLLGRHAEFLDHLGAADALVLHRVVHDDAVVHELHEVLVGRHDGGGRAGLAGDPRVGRDQVVGLVAGLLQARNIEGAHRLADQRELRNEVVGRRRPMRLVFLVHLGAEGFFRLVEHHREMGRPLVRLHLVEQLPQHVAEAVDGVDLHAVRRARLEPDRVIGAEDVAGTVDQEDVVALLERPRRMCSVERMRVLRLWLWIWRVLAWRRMWARTRVNQSARKCSHRKCVFSCTTRLCWTVSAMQAHSAATAHGLSPS